MSLRLRKVTLSNIRHHRSFVFEPASEGVTAIRGATGAGKSSIVDSVAWVLYGVKPRGVSKNSAIMNDQASWGKDKFYAEVEMEVDSAVIKVQRRIVTKAGATECDVWESQDLDTPSWEHKAGAATTSAEAYVRQRLKMDAKGFLAAVLVQQKQVDSLVTASAAERAQVIEKLTGISSATAALRKARDEVNEVRRTLALADVDEEEADRLHTQEVLLAEQVEEASSKVTDLERQVAEAVSAEQQASASAGKAQEAFNKDASRRERKAALEAQAVSLKETLAEAVAFKDSLRAELKAAGALADLDQVVQQCEQAQDRLTHLEQVSARFRQQVETLEEAQQEAQQVCAASGAGSMQEAQELLEGARLEVAQQEEALAGAREKVGAFRAEAEKLARAAKVLSRGAGCCPTCMQTVDDVEAVTGVLEQQAQEAFSKAQEQENLVQAGQDTLRAAKARTEALEAACEGFSQVEVITSRLSKGKAATRKAEADAKAAGREVAALRRSLDDARRADDLRRRADEARARALALSDRVEETERALADLDQEVTDKPPTAAALDRLRRRWDKTRQDLQGRKDSLAECVARRDVLQERLVSAQVAASRARADVERHRGLLRDAEQAVTALGVVEGFREARVRDAVPVIEAYASDLIARFTDGKFNQLLLDEKFNASVVLADGRTRPVGMLSGGEMSAAAIALRLAVSLLLNGGASRSLVILDEVLVSQDYTRAESIIETVKAVCQGQVVLIAHNDMIDAHSDKVVEVS